MTGRQRIAEAAGSEQPRRRWTLERRDDHTDVWLRDDGYKVWVWCTPVDAVRLAQLVSPSGMSRGLAWGRRGRHAAGKAEQVIAWLADPESFLRPPAVTA